MKKLLALLLIAFMAMGAFAADNIYRGSTKDLVACYQGGRFYSDAARKNQIYHHPGNMVSKEKKATLQNCIYRLMGEKIYKGSSVAKPDCIATIFETATSKGDTLAAKVYEGFVIPRDVQKTYDKATKTDTVTASNSPPTRSTRSSRRSSSPSPTTRSTAATPPMTRTAC